MKVGTTKQYGFSKRYYRQPAGLGPIGEHVNGGQLVAPVLVEQVTEVWRDGKVTRTVELMRSGNLALAMPAAVEQ